MTVFAFDPNRTQNEDLIVDAHRVGWIRAPVFDATYGRGVMWKKYRPDVLMTNDLRFEADLRHDWLKPFPAMLWSQFLTALYDPPYKLNGDPTDDDRYGVDERVSVPERMRRVRVGAVNCMVLVAPGGRLLVKCMDQTSLHAHHSQTTMVIGAVLGAVEWPQRWTHEGQLHLQHKPRAQVKRVRPANNYSTLLCFRRGPDRKRRPVGMPTV